jgi:hypothetical protein
MKKILTKLMKLISVVVFLMAVLPVIAQQRSPLGLSDFNLTLANDVQTASNILEFDVYLLDTDPTQAFEMAAVQAGILVNPAIYNGGTITMSIVPGSSQLIASQQPTSVVWSQAQNAIKLTPKTPPGAGSGTIISTTAPGTRVCRLRITNSVDFTTGSQANLTFNFTTSPYPTKVFQYISGANTELVCNTQNCFSNAANITLNPPVSIPTAYTVTGGGAYCQGSGGLPVGLSNSEVGVTYTLYKDAVAQVPTVAGTGSAITFGNQLAGTYSVSGTNSGGTTAMTGSAILTETSQVTPAVTISVSSNPVLTGTTVTFTPTPVNGGTPSYQWFVNGNLAGSGLTYVYIPVNGDQVYAVMTSSLSCVSSVTATSNTITMAVNTNQPPTVTITAPVNGATPAVGAPLTLTATAGDVDGSVTSVEFFSGAGSLGFGTFSAGVYSLTYTPVVLGPVTYTAKATDNNGAQTTSVPVTVTITDFTVSYAITFVTEVCNVQSVCMPIRAITGAVNVSGYNFTVAYDKTKVVPTANVTVSDALLQPFLAVGQSAADITDYTTSIDAVNGKISIAIYFNATANVNAVFNGIGDVCCVEFNKLAGFQSVDVAVFTFAEIIESYQSLPSATKQGSPGNFTSYRDEIFAGSLKFWSDMSPIQYDPLNPGTYLITNIFGCGSLVNAVQPDLSGNFDYNTTNGSTIDIKRDIAASTNVHSVINAQDAYLTALVSVKGNYTPQVYQVIAMDVNRDGFVTAGDASQINRRAISLIPQFSQVDGLGKDWSFVASTLVASNPAYTISAIFPEDDGIGYSKYRTPVVAVCQAIPTDGADCPTIQDENYIGIMVGDVDGTYAGITPNGTIKSMTADTSEIIIDLANATLNNGTMSIPVSLTCSTVVNSFDFDLLINDLMATVQSVESQYNLDYSWNYIAATKMLSVAAFSLNAIPVNNTISIVLSILTSEPITSSDLTESLALVNGLIANMIIIDATTAITDAKENMIKVYPNPATDKLNVEVSVSSKLQMLDINGKQVIAVQNVNANQKQTIDVSNLAPGVYMMKIYNDKFVNTKKVVIKK